MWAIVSWRCATAETTSASAYTTGARIDHATRYPMQSDASRTTRLLAMERAYNPATSAMEGSIIAAIMCVQMPANVGRSNPIVPSMLTIPRAIQIVPAQATAPAPATAAAYGTVSNQVL